MRLRPQVCGAVLSALAAPVTWFVWSEQSPFERDMTALASDLDFKQVSPDMLGYAHDPGESIAVFESDVLDKGQAESLIDRYDAIVKENETHSLYVCGASVEWGRTIQWPRHYFVFHEGRTVHANLYDSPLHANRAVLVLRKDRLSPLDRVRQIVTPEKP